MLCVLLIDANAALSMPPSMPSIGTSLAVVEPKTPSVIMLPKKHLATVCMKRGRNKRRKSVNHA